LRLEIHPHHIIAEFSLIEPAQVVGDGHGWVVLGPAYLSTHGDSHGQDKCDLQVDASGLLGAGLQKYEDEHADRLKPEYLVQAQFHQVGVLGLHDVLLAVFEPPFLKQVLHGVSYVTGYLIS